MRQSSAAVLAAAGVVSLVFAVQAQAPPTSPGGRGAAHTYHPPRTAWGDPDLEGRWPGTGASAIPLQRPESFGARNLLTDAEFAERAARASPSVWSVGDSRRRSIGSNGPGRSARHR
jgi:hypothetical protein